MCRQRRPFPALKLVFALAIAVLLTACSTPELPDLAAAPDIPPVFPSEKYANPGLNQAVYRLDPASSVIELRVFKSGKLARFGHNHIIVAPVHGAFLTDDSRILGDLFIRAKEFQVDPDALRIKAGEAFASEPSEDDKTGTLANMLSEQLLHAEQFPFITASIDLAGVEDEKGRQAATVFFTVKNRQVKTRVPVSLQQDAQRMVGDGMFELSHAEIGLIPFSALNGGLKVADTIEIRFHLEAVLR